MSNERTKTSCVLITTASYREHQLLAIRAEVLEAVVGQGLIPIVVYAGMPREALANLLANASGVVLPGGPDISPHLYGERPEPETDACDPERDLFELELIRKAMELGIPIFGICRGLQMLGVAVGGELHQHLPKTFPWEVHGRNNPVYAHLHEADSSHPVILERGSQIAKALAPLSDGNNTVVMPSLHHQGLNTKALSPNRFRIAGLSPGGVVEAGENIEANFMAVQSHPELGTRSRNPYWQDLMNLLFALFAEKVRAVPSRV